MPRELRLNCGSLFA